MSKSSKPVASDPRVNNFVHALRDTHSLLTNSWQTAPSRNVSEDAESLPSLLDRCRELAEEAQGQRVEPIRTIHHFACTGGSLITKCLAALPNVQLLSEADPLSDLNLRTDNTAFAPTDLIRLLRYNLRDTSNSVIEETFLGAIGAMCESLAQRGERLLIRDHTHSHYCTAQFLSSRRPLRELLNERFPVKSIITVRHPLDSFVSLQLNGWVHFEPRTFDEYCRRYLAFLDDYSECNVFRYEDIVESTHTEVERMADSLRLKYDPSFYDTLEAIRVTGDSGRRGRGIERRPRRSVPDTIQREVNSSHFYSQLCERLGYDSHADVDE